MTPTSHPNLQSYSGATTPPRACDLMHYVYEDYPDTATPGYQHTERTTLSTRGLVTFISQL